MIHTDIFFYLSLVVLAVGSYFDIRSSRKFIYYGTSEGMPLWKNRWGYFDARKNIIWFGVFVAVMIALRFAYFGNQVGIAFYIIGAGRLAVSFYNEAGMKKNRIEQREMLTVLRQMVIDGITDPFDPAMQKIFKNNPVTVKNGRAFYRLFGWLYIEGNYTNATSVQPLREKIIAYAANVPPDKWFPA